VRDLAAQLEERIAASAAQAPVPVALDAQTREALHELGYVTGRTTIDAGRLGVVGGTDPKDARGLLDALAQVQIALHRGAPADALALLRPLGDGPLVAAQRAAAAIGAGLPEEAEGDARKVLVEQPGRGDVRLILVQALLAQGREAEADAELARIAPEESASAPWAALRVAGAALEAGESSAAIEILERGRSRHPEDLSLAIALGGLFEDAGRLEDALAVREAALRVEPGSAGLQNDVAWTLALLVRDLDRAQALAESASRGLPEDPAILDTLGAVRRARENQ
jgi:predicted Zn-dependent protease